MRRLARRRDPSVRDTRLNSKEYYRPRLPAFGTAGSRHHRPTPGRRHRADAHALAPAAAANQVVRARRCLRRWLAPGVGERRSRELEGLSPASSARTDRHTRPRNRRTGAARSERAAVGDHVDRRSYADDGAVASAAAAAGSAQPPVRASPPPTPVPPRAAARAPSAAAAAPRRGRRRSAAERARDRGRAVARSAPTSWGGQRSRRSAPPPPRRALSRARPTAP